AFSKVTLRIPSQLRNSRSRRRGCPGRRALADSSLSRLRAGQAAPYGRDRPARPHFVQRWSSPVNGGRGEARWTFPASHSNTVEIDDIARPSCRNRYGSARPEAPVYSDLRVLFFSPLLKKPPAWETLFSVTP